MSPGPGAQRSAARCPAGGGRRRSRRGHPQLGDLRRVDPDLLMRPTLGRPGDTTDELSTGPHPARGRCSSPFGGLRSAAPPCGGGPARGARLAPTGRGARSPREGSDAWPRSPRTARPPPSTGRTTGTSTTPPARPRVARCPLSSPPSWPASSSAHRVIELGVRQQSRLHLFSSYGHQVTGVDGSGLPSSLLGPRRRPRRVRDAPPVGDHDGARSASPGPRAHLVYARFFVHAITDVEEQRFLDLAAELTLPR